MASAEQKKFEDSLGANRQHTNKQTFGADASVVLTETIATPGVDIAGKMACLITAIQVVPDFQTAHAAILENYRCQIVGGQQSALLMPDDPKYIAEYRLWVGSTGTGISNYLQVPFVFANPTKPMLIVNPHMTIMHVATNIADIAGDDVYTMFSYQVIPLTLEMHTSLMHAQMDLT